MIDTTYIGCSYCLTACVLFAFGGNQEARKKRHGKELKIKFSINMKSQIYFNTICNTIYNTEYFELPRRYISQISKTKSFQFLLFLHVKLSHMPFLSFRILVLGTIIMYG